MFKEIDERKQKLEDKRPLPINTVRSIRDNLLVEWTYNSNAIEGNTLTLSETKVVLEGITIGGKTLREHLEVVNHRDAILYIEDIVSKKEVFSEWQIKSIHRLILKGIDDENAGAYRKENVMISGAKHIPSEFVCVQHEMELFIQWYEGKAQKLHPIERACLVHAIFVKIHPFIDRNGRTARLLLNLELMKTGYPPVVVKKEKRSEYYDALDKAHTTGDYKDFINIIAVQVSEMFDLYEKLI